MEPVIYRRQITAIWRLIQVLPVATGDRLDGRADAAKVGRRPLQVDLEVMADGPDVFVNRGGSIDVGDEQIEPAVVVSVGVRGAISGSGLPHAPRRTTIRESQVATAVQQIIPY